MIKKYIFLDIDGVIATPESIVQGMWSLTDRCQDELAELLNQTDARIVISSSWRRRNLTETIESFEKANFRFCDKIVGQTIRAYHYVNKENKIHLSLPRGLEIDQWIDTHIHSEDGKSWNRLKVGIDFNYVIIDDDADMLLEQKDNFVQTDSMIGLTTEKRLEAQRILNNMN